MKQKKQHNRLFFSLFVLAIISVFSMLLINLAKVSTLNAPGVFDSDYGSLLDISFDIYRDGKFVETSKLPYSFQSSTMNKDIALVGTLPEDKTDVHPFISFRTPGNSVKVEIDNEEVYNFYKEGAKDYGGGYAHFIKVPPDSNNKQIKISLFCPNNNPFSKNVYPIYTGSKGYLLIENFDYNFASLFFGVVLIAAGLLFLGNIIFFSRTVGSAFLFSLSLILICFGSWVFCQSSSRQLVGITNPTAPMIISFFAMFSLPFCTWFYIKTNYTEIGEIKILKRFALLILFLYIPISIFSYLGIMYTNFLGLIGILILVFMLLVLAFAIKLFKGGNKSLLSCILALLSTLVSIVIDEVCLILRVPVGNVSIMHAGMAIAATIFIYKSIGNLIEKNTEEYEAQLLKKLAYVDVATLVENRNAYEMFIENEAPDLYSCGIILADVNGLKIINDMHGHKSGDALLVKLSSSLKQSLPDDSKLYRIGGDEFISILMDTSKEEFTKIVRNLEKKFTPNDNDCGMAIGSYYYVKNIDGDISKAIEKTDKNMYKHKQSQRDLIHECFLKTN